MCNCEHDFDNLIPKYKHKYSILDKIMVGFIFTIMSIATIALLLSLFNSHGFTC